MTRRLESLSALVTGSTRGIGAAIAQALAREGARVLITGRNEMRGQRVVNQIIDEGGHAELFIADLSAGYPAADLLAGQSAAILGQVNILVNNAALLVPGATSASMTESVIRETLRIGIEMPFRLTANLASEMAERGSGAVVNIGSVNGILGTAPVALYGATKAALHSLTKAWSAEYGPRGVRVNAIAPGPTATESNVAIRSRLEQAALSWPSTRLSSPDEIASAAVFLASSEASNIHGVVLSVDGGRAAI